MWLATCKVIPRPSLGWRKNMEDSKIHRINLPGNISVFGVFDGHGGNHSPLL